MVAFNFTFAEGTPIEVMSAFWEAGDAWSTERIDSRILDVVTDDVTINIYVDYGELAEAALAGSRPGMTRVSYTDFSNKYNQDVSSFDDASAANYLELGDSFQYLRETYNPDTNTWGETSEIDTGNSIWLTRANAKALNLIDNNSSDFDASIRVSNSAPWHFDSTTGVPGDKYDLLTVAGHEIVHVLGFISGTDVFELLSQEGDITQENLDYVSPMDLLRYSTSSSELGVSDWTRGQTYFSLDGGNSNLGDFSTGAANDGFQGSHWKDGDSRGIATPLIQLGERIEISDLDLRLLDAIGWDRIPQLQADVEKTIEAINWDDSNPNLTSLENLLTGYVDEQLARLAEERNAIAGFDPEIADEIEDLEEEADETSQSQREAIQITLSKVEENKNSPELRLEAALKGTSDIQKSLADLDLLYKNELQQSFNEQIEEWLDDSPTELSENLDFRNVSDLQLVTLAITVSSASESKQAEWNSKIRDALGLLYRDTFNGQSPTGTELDAALAKLLSISTIDELARRGSGGSGIRFWQTGGSNLESVTINSQSLDITGATTIDNDLNYTPESYEEVEAAAIDISRNNLNVLGNNSFENWQASANDVFEPIWEVNNIESTTDLYVNVSSEL